MKALRADGNPLFERRVRLRFEVRQISIFTHIFTFS